MRIVSMVVLRRASVEALHVRTGRTCGGGLGSRAQLCKQTQVNTLNGLLLPTFVGLYTACMSLVEITRNCFQSGIPAAKVCYSRHEGIQAPLTPKQWLSLCKLFVSKNEVLNQTDNVEVGLSSEYSHPGIISLGSWALILDSVLVLYQFYPGNPDLQVCLILFAEIALCSTHHDPGISQTCDPVQVPIYRIVCCHAFTGSSFPGFASACDARYALPNCIGCPLFIWHASSWISGSFLLYSGASSCSHCGCSCYAPHCSRPPNVALPPTYIFCRSTRDTFTQLHVRCFPNIYISGNDAICRCE